MADDARTAISCAVCWRIAIDATTIGAPAAAANVSASWKLIPHSAWPAARSASGAVLPYGQHLEVDRRHRAYQPFGLGDVEPGVVRVRRPVEGQPDGRRRRRPDGDGGRPRRRRRGRAGGAEDDGGRRPASRRRPRRRRTARRQRARRGGVGMDCAGPRDGSRPALEHENAASGCRGRRQRVDGPASFAGTSRIRFRGSVAIATLSAHGRSPEAVFGCGAMVHRPIGPGRRAVGR